MKNNIDIKTQRIKDDVQKIEIFDQFTSLNDQFWSLELSLLSLFEV
jgi:hypothetical protein